MSSTHQSGLEAVWKRRALLGIITSLAFAALSAVFVGLYVTERNSSRSPSELVDEQATDQVTQIPEANNESSGCDGQATSEERKDSTLGESYEEIGMWESVIPKANGAARSGELGTHSIHIVVLPSEKLLIVPGSGWRNLEKEGTNYKAAAYTFDEAFDEETGARRCDIESGEGVCTYVGDGSYPNRNFDPFKNEEFELYYRHQNNAATYDPKTNEFFRVPHPKPVEDEGKDGYFKPSDMFCAGHLQLPDGNAMFVGGTQFAAPFYTGHSSTFIWDWVEDVETDWASYDWTEIPATQVNAYSDAQNSSTPWKFSGNMAQGRWYPSVIPLMDGRFVIVAGFKDMNTNGVYNVSDRNEMHLYEMNSAVDFFDYRKFDPSAPSTSAWDHIVVRDTENSPFQTVLEDDETGEAAVCGRSSEDGTPFWDIESHPRLCETNKNDTFKLYPRAYLMPDNRRIFFTRDGDFNSMQSENARHQRKLKYSFIMDTGTDPENPTISFERGPELIRTAYNSAGCFRDPTDNNRLIITGGMPPQGGYYSPSLLPWEDERCNFHQAEYNIKLCNKFLGGSSTRGAVAYRMPDDDDDKTDGKGEWEPQINDFYHSDRVMHYDVILPNKQIFVVGGGQYWFGHSSGYPILLTPTGKGQFDKGIRVAFHMEDRLYHSNAVLLADGRVFFMGGNPNRALHRADAGPLGTDREDGTPGQKKFNPSVVERRLFFMGHDNGAAFYGKGSPEQPRTELAESWTAEIYSPPYLFIDGNRRTKINKMSLVSVAEQGLSFIQSIGNKNHYLLHSSMTIEMDLDGLPAEESCTDDRLGTLALVKLASNTHGWDNGQQLFDIPIESLDYGSGLLTFTTPSAEELQIIPAFYHLFYIDCKGKPAKAESVRFDNNVLTLHGRAAPPSQ